VEPLFQSKEKISAHQGLMLVIGGAIGNIFIIIASPASIYAGRDAWIAVFLAYLLAAINGLVLIDLARRFPKKTFVQYLPDVLGKFLGKLAGLFYILAFWILTPLIMSEIMELMRFFLRYTPLIYINILISILIVIAMRSGFEVYARTAEQFVVLMVFILFLVICASIPNIEIENILPLLDNGIMPIVKSQTILFSYAVETILFMALWFPCLNKIKEGRRIMLIGMAIGGSLLTILVLITTGILSLELLNRTVYPSFNLSRYIYIGNFLGGFEAIFMILWMFSSYIQLLTFYYPSVVGLAQWMNLKDYKPLVIPIVAINILLAMIPLDIVQIIRLDTLKNTTILLPLSILIPITWLIAVIRGLDESK
jgi:spore germination protein KB